jgi:hypothetical protein
VAMSDAVIRRKINMPESTIIQLNTRSCNRSNRARVGRGATSTKSCSSLCKELLEQFQEESQRKPVGAGYSLIASSASRGILCSINWELLLVS